MKTTLLILGLLLLAACTTAVETQTVTEPEPQGPGLQPEAPAQEVQVEDEKGLAMPEVDDEVLVEETSESWRTTKLTNVLDDTTYSVADFEGKHVFLESFAVWCPTCTKQQKNIQEFHDAHPEVVSIAIDTDPNEDANAVKTHAERNGFDWRYSVAPSEMTLSLIDEFGTTIVSAPSVPLIHICPDGNAELLSKRGAKSVEDLEATLARCEA